MIGSCIGPFAKRGLDEAFGFAVGLGGVWPGEDLAKTEAFAGCSETLGAVARAIIGHHTLDPDTQPGIIGDSGLKESHSTFLALIRHDLDEGDARSIVDADVDELPADAMMAIDRARIATSDAMPHIANAAKVS